MGDSPSNAVQILSPIAESRRTLPMETGQRRAIQGRATAFNLNATLRVFYWSIESRLAGRFFCDNRRERFQGESRRFLGRPERERGAFQTTRKVTTAKDDG